ncbi:HAD family hydrolase [Fusibacter sp. JL298sf-3]
MIDFSTVDAIIFDLDGTLVDSMWIWKQIDIDFLEKRGLTLPSDLQKDIEGMSFTETAHYFINRFEMTEPIEAIQSEWLEMAETYYEKHIPLKEGAFQLLVEAAQNGVKLGVGTSNSRYLLEKVLNAHGILNHFHALRTSCEVVKGKPAPDVFLKVAEDLEVPPEKCLVFEDTHAGVLAGKRAGMQVIAVFDALSAPYQEAIIADADGFINSFSEVLNR